MNYQLIVNWIDIALVLAFLFFSCFLWYYFLYFGVASKRPRRLPKATKFTKFAILIPARNESNVIRNILNACEKLDYPKEFFDVYVIIESLEDPTNEIVKEFGFNVIVRGDLTNRKTKGFALDDAYQEIKKRNLDYIIIRFEKKIEVLLEFIEINKKEEIHKLLGMF